MNFSILDCTLRDGGYYTDWDFDEELVCSYIKGVNQLPIDYIEVGYRNLPMKGYQGKFSYTPIYILRHLRELAGKKLAVMLNEKSTKPSDLTLLVEPIKGLVDMIRIAVNPANIQRAIVLAKSVKEQGFEVGFNIMYMSKWDEYKDFYSDLAGLKGVVDVMNMVDSFGGALPDDVTSMVLRVKDIVECKIGFHGHNNLQMGLINALAAIEAGIDSVDCTILGMGRGAGNLNTELLLTYLNNKGLDVDFTALSDVITVFQPLLERYHWGTQLPYMISGANSLPQKEVMDLVTNRVYSFDSIVRGLQNKKDKILDNAKYPLLNEGQFDEVIIIGGGNTPVEHIEGITSFINSRKSVALVFATARHAAIYQAVNVPKYFCLIGREAKRLAKNITGSFNDKCVLPPYPRKLGTDVPGFAENKTFELEKISFTCNYLDSCTTLAIQVALDLAKSNIYIVGYDGYPSSILSEKEMALTNENRTLFADYHSFSGHKLVSLTNSLYNELDIKSVYQYL